VRVTSYGLFWWRDEIQWAPGSGKRNTFRLLGHIDKRKDKIRIADFRHQRGIYVLYDDYGPSYVGLTRDLGLGARLKNHTTDHLKRRWDRFSWFGFRDIIPSEEHRRYFNVDQSGADTITDDMNTTIGDLEALMILTMGPKHNRKFMGFSEAEQWDQVFDDDSKEFCARLGL
jgi:hypothetical protein